MSTLGCLSSASLLFFFCISDIRIIHIMPRTVHVWLSVWNWLNWWSIPCITEVAKRTNTSSTVLQKFQKFSKLATGWNELVNLCKIWRAWNFYLGVFTGRLMWKRVDGSGPLVSVTNMKEKLLGQKQEPLGVNNLGTKWTRFSRTIGTHIEWGWEPC